MRFLRIIPSAGASVWRDLMCQMFQESIFQPRAESLAFSRGPGRRWRRRRRRSTPTRVAAYSLDRRHLLSAFELYQDLICLGDVDEGGRTRRGPRRRRGRSREARGFLRRSEEVRAVGGARTPMPSTVRPAIPPPRAPESPLVSSPGRRDATGSNTRPESNTLPPTVPALRAMVREQGVPHQAR